jgi:hypothetical protein
MLDVLAPPTLPLTGTAIPRAALVPTRQLRLLPPGQTSFVVFVALNWEKPIDISHSARGLSGCCNSDSSVIARPARLHYSREAKARVTS